MSLFALGGDDAVQVFPEGEGVEVCTVMADGADCKARETANSA
jgi:hypothetical protein